MIPVIKSNPDVTLIRMKRWSKIFFVCLVMSLTGGKASASETDTLQLTLKQCLDFALGSSPDLQLARLDSIATESRWRSTSAKSYPQLKMQLQAPDRSESVDYGITYDPAVQQEEYRKIEAGDTRWLSSLQLEQALPWGATLDFSTRLYRSTWHNDRIGSGGDTTEYSLRRSVYLDQPLFEGNPVGRSRKIGRLNRQEGLIDFELRRRQVRYRATLAFFGLVSARGELEIAESGLEQARDAEELAQRKLKAGLIPEVELLQIQVDLARREASYRSNEDAVEKAEDQLRLVLGLPPVKKIEAIWEPQPIDEDRNLTEDSGIERLELAKERLNLEQAEIETRIAVLSERISTTLSVYYEIDIRRPEFADLEEAGDRNMGVVLNIDFPIFGFGSTSGRVEELRANLRRSRLSYQVTQAEHLNEMRDILRSIRQAADRITIADAALGLSERSYDITADRFGSGLVDSRELLDAQIELSRTRSDALNARIDYHLALANLERISPQTIDE